jgi:hypothetical protein
MERNQVSPSANLPGTLVPKWAPFQPRCLKCRKWKPADHGLARLSAESKHVPQVLRLTEGCTHGAFFWRSPRLQNEMAGSNYAPTT